MKSTYPLIFPDARNDCRTKGTSRVNAGSGIVNLKFEHIQRFNFFPCRLLLFIQFVYPLGVVMMNYINQFITISSHGQPLKIMV